MQSEFRHVKMAAAHSTNKEMCHSNSNSLRHQVDVLRLKSLFMFTGELQFNILKDYTLEPTSIYSLPIHLFPKMFPKM